MGPSLYLGPSFIKWGKILYLGPGFAQAKLGQGHVWTEPSLDGARLSHFSSNLSLSVQLYIDDLVGIFRYLEKFQGKGRCLFRRHSDV